jgi:hypothetical protein
MKGKEFFGMVCAATVLLLSSCDSNTSMVGPSSNETSGVTGSSTQTIDPMLDKLNPELMITPVAGNTYRLGMIVGAGGTADSPEMQTLHSIRAVRFDVMSPANELIATRLTDSVPSSGVMDQQTGRISITTSTAVNFTPDRQLPEGTYAVMTVQGMNGVAVRSAELPFGQFAH